MEYMYYIKYSHGGLLMVVCGFSEVVHCCSFVVECFVVVSVGIISPGVGPSAAIGLPLPHRKLCKTFKKKEEEESKCVGSACIHDSNV